MQVMTGMMARIDRLGRTTIDDLACTATVAGACEIRHRRVPAMSGIMALPHTEAEELMGTMTPTAAPRLRQTVVPSRHDRCLYIAFMLHYSRIVALITTLHNRKAPSCNAEVQENRRLGDARRLRHRAGLRPKTDVQPDRKARGGSNRVAKREVYVTSYDTPGTRIASLGS